MQNVAAGFRHAGDLVPTQLPPEVAKNALRLDQMLSLECAIRDLAKVAVRPILNHAHVLL